MRKLSEILKEQLTKDKGILTPRSSQSFVLFSEVLVPPVQVCDCKWKA